MTHSSISKVDRKNKARLIQASKRSQLLEEKRIFSGKNGAPKIVTVIALNDLIDTPAVIRSLKSSCPDSKYFYSERHKQRIQYLDAQRHFEMAFDTSQVADFILLLFPPSFSGELDELSSLIIKCILHSGLPSIIPAIVHDEADIGKKIDTCKKFIQEFFTCQFAENAIKVHLLSLEKDRNDIERIICTQKLKHILWRENRPYMTVDHLEASKDNTLILRGYSRGKAFSANNLIHIPNLGDFPIQIIRKINTCSQNEMEIEGQIQYPNPEDNADMDENQSMESEDNEDSKHINTFSTSMALNDNLKQVKVPRGTSSYQAAWIEEPTIKSNSEISEEDDDNENMIVDEEFSNEEEVEDNVDFDNVSLEDRVQIEDELDAEEEQQQLEEFKRKRQQEANDDYNFPDEVTVPTDVPASQRFAKYRGLKSFRNAAWDKNEGLPEDYSKIYQFENYKTTRKRALLETDSPFSVGDYLEIVVSGISPDTVEGLLAKYKGLLNVFGLLRHEGKTCVLNFTVKKENSVDEPVKSKDLLLLILGYRKFLIRPLFSAHSNTALHKFYKFLPSGVSVGTAMGVVMHSPAPILLLTAVDESATMQLIGSGSLLDVDSNRLLIKRITLSGHVFKVNRRSAVIRYMFYTPEDINYFRPVELTTSSGRHGHIKGSLGTHGYMKCVFDKPLANQELVCMHLYRRVFPKFLK